MHSLISLVTNDAFYQGIGLLNTWRTSEADEFCLYYSDDCRRERLSMARRQGAIIRPLQYEDFYSRKMFYKMVMIRDFLRNNKSECVTYVDFDTMVIRPWNHIWDHKFDFGMTVRPNPRSPLLNVNAGVLFVKNNQRTIDFLDWCITCIRAAVHYPENTHKKPADYSRWQSIFKSEDLLEFYVQVPTINSINFRKLNWWGDQIFLSGICEEIYKQHDYPVVSEFFSEVFGCKFGLFNCPIYNDTGKFKFPTLFDPTYLADRYIIHFKGKRKKLVYPSIIAHWLAKDKRKGRQVMTAPWMSEFPKKDRRIITELMKEIGEKRAWKAMYLEKRALVKSFKKSMISAQRRYNQMKKRGAGRRDLKKQRMLITSSFHGLQESEISFREFMEGKS